MVVLISFAFAACSVKMKERDITITRGGEIVSTVHVEVATTAKQREKGLMGRKELQNGNGMLFVFDTDSILSFWMKDTYIPLSIAFISGSGKIIDLFDMQPEDLTPICSTALARYAIEVPQGWFAETGVQTGDTVNNL